jgi:hypothetical protein
MIKQLTLIWAVLIGGEVENLSTNEVLEKIILIAPHTSVSTARKVEKGLKECKGLDENLVLAVIRVESNFKINAVNKRSNDFGLMQVNNWHVKRFKYDKLKLLTNASYNMKIGCSILSEFVGKDKSSNSIGRYNCGYQKNCLNWKPVKKYIKKVLTFKKKLDNMNVQ